MRGCSRIFERVSRLLHAGIYIAWLVVGFRNHFSYPNIRNTMLALLVIGCIYTTISTEYFASVYTDSQGRAAAAGFAGLTIAFYLGIILTGLW